MPASLVGTYRAMARNNAWANHRLLAACARLTQEEFEAPRTGFFPEHQGDAQPHPDRRLVLRRWPRGRLARAQGVGRPEPCATVADLQREQAAVDRRLIAVCEALTEESLGAYVRLNRDTRVQTERRDRLLLHLFQHQIHHRGQAHAMLSGTRVKPPQLDEFYLRRRGPAARARNLRRWAGPRRRCGATRRRPE